MVENKLFLCGKCLFACSLVELSQTHLKKLSLQAQPLQRLLFITVLSALSAKMVIFMGSGHVLHLKKIVVGLLVKTISIIVFDGRAGL
jgi:hypothetical protein